jgi:hypothetical protein
LLFSPLLSKPLYAGDIALLLGGHLVIFPTSGF